MTRLGDGACYCECKQMDCFLYVIINSNHMLMMCFVTDEITAQVCASIAIKLFMCLFVPLHYRYVLVWIKM